MANAVKKKCARCGHVSVVERTRRRCYRPRFGKGSYACWGELARVVPKPRGKKTLKEAIFSMALSPQAKAVDELAVVRKKLAARNEQLRELAMKVGAVAGHVRDLERRAARLESRAAMTDEEVEAERQKAVERAQLRAQRRTKRGISLKDGP